MPYIERTVNCGNVIEKEKYFTYFYKSAKVIREPRTKETDESQKRANEKRAAKKLRWLLNTNFGPGDLFLTLTYKKEEAPEDIVRAKKDLRNYLLRIKRAYEKQGIELLYVAVTEYGKRGQVLHHHIAVNKFDIQVLNNKWGKGFVRATVLEQSGQYKELAEYMIKETRNISSKKKQELYGKKRWMPSRNLKEPKITKKVVKANSWRADPKPKKKYYLTDCSTGVNELTGYPYQRYTLLILPQFMKAMDPPIFKKKKKRRKYTKHIKTQKEKLF